MGCDCNIYLQGDALSHDIMSVLGILLGFEKTQESFDYSSKFDHVVVKDVAYAYSDRDHYKIFAQSGSCPEHFLIEILENPLDKEWHMLHCHFQPKYLLLSGGSSNFWKTVGIELIKFFGGYIDYNDCDTYDMNFSAVCPRIKGNRHENDPEFHLFQEELWALQPIKKLVNL